MKKIIGILFLLLICLTTFSVKWNIWDMNYELAIECEEGEKEEKKEIKEFPINSHNKTFSPLSLTNRYKRQQDLIHLQVVLDQHTPPPDTTCQG